MRLVLVRHAETVENVERVFQGHNPGVLSDRGRKQAEKLAERLLGAGVGFVYCSDLSRCKDTLAPFLKYKGVPVVYTEVLRERDFGVFNGRKLEEFYGWLDERGV
jgi:broad specificity phosphatase PhoE